MSSERGKPGKAGSLLSAGTHPHSKDRSLLSGVASSDGADHPETAMERYRAARSRRTAIRSPLLTALEEEPELEEKQRARRQAENNLPPDSAFEPDGSTPDRNFGQVEGAAGSTAGDAPPSRREQPSRPVRRTAPRPSANDGYFGEDGEPWRPMIEPMAVISGILRSKMLIVAATIVGAVIGVMVALSTPKTYISTAEVLIDPRELNIVDRELAAGNLPSDATLAIIENQVRLMYSSSVLNAVAAKLKLDRDPEFNGGRGGFGLSGIISAMRSLFSTRRGMDQASLSSAIAVETLAENLNIERGGRTFVVSVRASSEDPEKSALIANAVVEAYVAASGDIQSNTASRAESELSGRLATLRTEVLEAERKVEEYRAQNDLIDARGGLISDEEILRLTDQLSSARARTLELNTRATSARAVGVDDVVSGALPEFVSSAVLGELRSQYAQLLQQSDRLSVSLGPRHPQREAATAELEGARRQISRELQRIVSALQVELKRAVELEQQLAARLAQAKVRQGQISAELVDLRELEREAAAKRSVYEAYLLRARQTAEQKDINTANIAIISVASPPLLPVGPSRSSIAMGFTIAGFLAGVMIGALRGAVDGLRGGNPWGPTSPGGGRGQSPAGGRTAQPSAILHGRSTWRDRVSASLQRTRGMGETGSQAKRTTADDTSDRPNEETAMHSRATGRHYATGHRMAPSREPQPGWAPPQPHTAAWPGHHGAPVAPPAPYFGHPMSAPAAPAYAYAAPAPVWPAAPVAAYPVHAQPAYPYTVPAAQPWAPAPAQAFAPAEQAAHSADAGHGGPAEPARAHHNDDTERELDMIRRDLRNVRDALMRGTGYRRSA